MGKRTAIYPGSFDPPTLGHLDLIERGSRLFDHLTVGVLTNPDKDALFTVAERVEMLEAVTRGIAKVSVETFRGLLVSYAAQKKCHGGAPRHTRLFRLRIRVADGPDES